MPMSTEVLYAYAIVPAGTELPQDIPGILPDTALALFQIEGFAALVSRVPRAAFGGDTMLIAEFTRAHHATIAAIAARGPVLPLAFGAVFTNAESLTAWLKPRAARLTRALIEVAGCAEFTLRLEEDTEGHIAWLDAHDADLQALSASTQDAGGDAAFLLGRRRARRITEARTARQAALSRDLAERLQHHARTLPGDMTALVRDTDLPALRADLDRMARDLSGTGLALRLVGPWPPYASAHAVLRGA